MAEFALPNDPFRHVWTRAIAAPLFQLFYSSIQAGRQNSIVLHEQVQTEFALDTNDPARFVAACREAMTFAQQLPSSRLGVVSPELLALARQAVEQQQARKDEDVLAWAARLASDVGNATD